MQYSYIEKRVERGCVERNWVTNLEDLGEIRLVKVSGAALGIGLMEAAVKLMNEMATFHEARVSEPAP